MSFFNGIYPILRENTTPVFMFVPTGFVGKNDFFWADKVEMAMKRSRTRAITLDGKKFYLHSRWYRRDFYAKVQDYVRVLDEKSRDEMCRRIFEQLNVRISEDDMAQYQFLDWPEILEMDRSGLVLFGSHSVNHPNLATLRDDALRYELLESKHALENNLGRPVRAFAYPYGAREFWDGTTISEIKRAGYSCAFTTIEGAVNGKRRDRFRLPRALLFDYQNEGAVALKLLKARDRARLTT
jgi:peptidoglycan/xylan/chitin deacetylase (PgdA/CDA1 family)